MFGVFQPKIEEGIVDQQTDIIQLVNDILYDGISKQASDIHFEMVEDQLRIRIRIDGKLYPYKFLEKSLHSGITTRLKIMANMDIAEKRLPQDGRFSFNYEGRDVDLRASSIPAVVGEKLVIRILDPIKFQKRKEELGLLKEDIDKINKLMSLENGMLILVGPTGCGKSTTLYSLLRELNTDDVNIITIEDPVEYKIPGINQIQVHENIDLTFSNALRSILRQDPEIIMIGEIRDLETAQIAVRASITGHRIFTTLHTNDAYSTIIRLLDMGIESYLLKSCLNGIISQRLVRRLCPHCASKRPPSEEEKDFIPELKEVEYLYEAVGCEKCIGGYKGRLAIMEILSIDRDFRNEIKEDIDLNRLRSMGKSKKIHNLLEKGIQYIAQGKTSYEEIVKLIIEME